MLAATADAAVKAAPVKKRKKETQLRQIMRRLVKNKPAVVGMVILGVIILACVLAPLIAPYDPDALDYTALHANPCLAHPLGCDNLGRDILSRLLYGGRVSLLLGAVVAVVGMAFGLFFGCLVGYYGGSVDNVAMRICDVWMAIPGTLLAIVISASMGSGFLPTVLALSMGGLPGSVRNARAMVLKEREMEYLEAAKAMNCSKPKIIYKHMMPNTVAPTIVGTTGQIGGTMMQSAGLSYIGLGIQPPKSEWGAMCSSAREFLTTHPLEMLWPGLIIMITVLAINLLGDGLRDAMDPKLKN